MVKADNLTADSFEASIYEQENKMDGHSPVTVSYLAIQPPAGVSASSFTTLASTSKTYDYNLQSESLDENWKIIGDHEYKLEEEQSEDSEVGHVYETVHFLQINGAEFVQIVTNNGEDTVSLRRCDP